MYKAVQMDDGSIHLVHHGILGQKWGRRRFQNEDGSLTPAGEERYYGDSKEKKSFKGTLNRAAAKIYESNEKYYTKHGDKAMARANKIAKEAKLKKAEEADKARNSQEGQARAAKLKKAAIIGGAALATALVAYGGYKLYQNNKANKAAAAEAAEFHRKMEQGKKIFDAMQQNLIERSHSPGFISGQVAYTLPDGTVLKTVLGGK